MKTFYYRMLVAAFIILGLAASVSGQNSADEARKHLVRGMAAIEMSKSDEGLAEAAVEFKKQLRLNQISHPLGTTWGRFSLKWDS